MMGTPRSQLLRLLEGYEHTVLTHPAAGSAREMARLRGTPLALGAKALLLKLGASRFAILGLPADRRLDSRCLRRSLRTQRFRFATVEEMRSLTSLTPGHLPPLGRPIFDLDLIVDSALASGSELVFSLAIPTASVRMRTRDYLALAAPSLIAALTVGEEEGEGGLG